MNSRGLVVIDSSVSALQNFVSASDSSEVLILNGDRDGIQQITDFLSTRENLSSLHIVSHGAAGRLYLGTTELSAANLDYYRDALKSWNHALTTTADVLVYGCDIASGELGSHFVRELSALTGADVAASTDRTGSHALQADWDLEFSTGTIESALAFNPERVQAFNQTLAPGLRGEYFDNVDFTAPVLTRTDATVDFDWGTGSPAPSIGVDTFSVRWGGKVKPLYSETYTFYTTADDGVRLFVNGQQIIDNFVDQPATERSGTIALTAGQEYDIRMEYYERGGGAVARLGWSSASQAKQIIPASQLSDAVNPPAPTGSGTGLRGEYFDNIDFTAPILTRTDATVNFNWGSGSPAPNIAADTFSVRWTGQIEPLYNETYTFYTTTDDGARLFINGQQVINSFINQAATERSGTIALRAGQRYDIRLEYFENGGQAEASLAWSSPSQTKQIVPQSQLYASTAPPTGAGITLTESGGNTAVTEGGATDSYTLVLNAQPTANVTISLNNTGGQTTTSISNLTFTPTNWNIPQAVTVTAVNDALAEGSHTGTITHTVASSDTRYANLAIAPLTVAITDNDTAPPPAGTGNGLLGEYFDNVDFTAPVLTRTDATVDFDWGNGSPAPTIAPDTFSVRWTGKVQPRYTETYTFYTTSDDGVRLFVNGQQIINNFVDQPPTERSGTIALVAGQQYDIRLEYYEQGGGAVSRLAWSSPSQTKQIIPQSQLFTPTSTTPPPATDTTAPTAALSAPTLDTPRTTPYTFTVTYTDATAVDVGSINGSAINSDIRVTGPNNFNQLAELVGVSPAGNGSPRTATYQVAAPDGIWNWNDKGTYTVTLLAGQVRDTLGNIRTTDTGLGTFDVAIASSIVLDSNLFEVSEGGGTVAIPIRRVGDATGVAQVNYRTQASTATEGADYTRTAGTLVFAAGETIKTLSVPVLEDTLSEGNEVFSFVIDQTVGADLGPSRTALVTILDNDSSALPIGIDYRTGFTSVSQLQLNGSATQASTALRLTPDASYQAGSAFFRTPLSITNSTSFQTNFQFRLTGADGTNGADGFTFVLLNAAGGVTQLGGSGSDFGYAGTTGQSLAIKFDTYQNGLDPNSNHIGILQNSNASNSLATATPAGIDLNGGSLINAWIDYSGATNRLDIFLASSAAKPAAPLLSQVIGDLATLLGSQVVVGFTGGTGGAKNNQDIQNWAFATDGTFEVAPPPPPPGGTGSTIALTSAAFQAQEGNPGLTFTVRRSGSTTGTATVGYATTDGTATAGSDYTATTGTLTFAPGEFEKTIVVPIANDTVPERTETLTLRLQSPTGTSLGAIVTATGSILDDDFGNFVKETVVTGLVQPTAFDWALSGSRMYVAQKNGIVRVVDNGSLLAQPFIDLSAEVNDVRDRGMLGIAVHPNFPANPYIYVSYTYDPPETQTATALLATPDEYGNRPSRLVRITADPATNYRTALPGSMVVLLGKNSNWQYTSRPDGNSTSDFAIPPSGIVNGTTITAPASLIEDSEGNIRDYLATDSETHTIGSIRFGVDGMLYVTNGDGTSYNIADPRTVRVQDVDNLSGKLLRIDPITGQGLSSNPFYNGNPDSNRSKVFAYGFRNPFRFAIQPGTGAPVLGDVGWFTWEEINIVPAVGSTANRNFGWPYYEGGNGVSQQSPYNTLPAAQAFYTSGAPVTAPIYARNHSEGAQAIMVGDFYTGTTFPTAYQGALFFGDVNTGGIDALFLEPSGAVNSIKSFATGVPGIVFMDSGPDSNLYYVDIVSGSIGRWRAV